VQPSTIRARNAKACAVLRRCVQPSQDTRLSSHKQDVSRRNLCLAAVRNADRQPSPAKKGPWRPISTLSERDH